MSKEIKLVAESLQEYNEVEELNEGSKKSLVKFINDPTKVKSFVNAFGSQIVKVKNLKKVLLKLDNEKKMAIAKQAYKALEADPTKAVAWLKIAGGKIVGATALAAKSESPDVLGQKSSM